MSLFWNTVYIKQSLRTAFLHSGKCTNISVSCWLIALNWHSSAAVYSVFVGAEGLEVLMTGGSCLIVDLLSSTTTTWRYSRVHGLHHAMKQKYCHLPFFRWVNGWMDGWMDGWISWLIDAWRMDRLIDGWINEWMVGWMDGSINEWVCEWVSAWVSECVSEWMNEWIMEVY